MKSHKLFALLTSICLIFGFADVLPAQNVDYVFKGRNDIDHLAPYSEGLALAKDYALGVGYIDTTGTFVIQPQFDDGGSFHEGRAWVAKNDSATNESTYGYINKKGKIVIPYQFDEVKNFSSDLAAVKKDSIWQYINKQGETVLDSRYVWKEHYQNNVRGKYHISSPKSFHNGWLKIRDGHGMNFVDRSGDTLSTGRLFAWVRKFSDGVAVVKLKAKSRRAVTGSDTLSKIYRSLPGKDKTAAKTAIIDTTGKVLAIMPDSIAVVQNFHDGLAQYRKGEKRYQPDTWGFINKQGKVIIPAKFKHVPQNFSEGIAMVQVDGERSDNKDGQMYILNTKGNIIAKIPLMDQKGRLMHDTKAAFHEGLLAVDIIVEPNTTFSKWGYMDKHGNMVIEPQFSKAFSFSNGRAVVVNDEGNVVMIKNPLQQQ